MSKEALTINEILNSDLMNQIIEQEDRDLADADWSYSEIKQVANLITKK